MQALRLARPRLALRAVNNVGTVRTIAATANSSAEPAGSSTSTPAAASVIPLSNVEAQWEHLSPEEQLTVHQQLEEIQKRDWKTLSIDEKKAGALHFFSPVLLACFCARRHLPAYMQVELVPCR
jgi:cytochrome c oxidase subunit 4